MPFKTIIYDLGMNAFIKEIKKLKKNNKVEIGIWSDKKRNDGLDNVSLMTMHEFGYYELPQRSIIRAGTDINLSEAFKQISNEYSLIIKSRSNFKELFNKNGKFILDKFQKRFSKQFLTPNAPYTIRKKGSDTPLVDTGQLKKSFKYKINGK